jgi:hemerythrin
MVETVVGVVDEVRSGARELDLTWLTSYLRDWILDHIPKYDKDAAEYFRMAPSGNKPEAVVYSAPIA